MTTRGITYWSVLLIAAVAVVWPITAEVPSREFAGRTLSSGGTVQCGSAVTAFRKNGTAASLGSNRGVENSKDGACQQAGEDRLIRTGLGSLLALFGVYAAWNVFGNKDDDEKQSDQLPEPEAVS